MRKNETGFGIIEIVLLIAVIGLIAAVGWSVYDRQKGINQQQAAPTSTDAAATDYAGWKLCKDDVQKISFKYPASWTGVCDPAYDNGVNGIRDGIDLTSRAKFPEVFQVSLYSGYTDGRPTGSDMPDTVVDVVPLSTTFNGRQLYAVFLADEWTERGQILQILLSDTKYSVGQSVAVTGVHSVARPSTFIVMGARMGDIAHQPQNFSVEQYKASSDYEDVVNVLKSFKSE